MKNIYLKTTWILAFILMNIVMTVLHFYAFNSSIPYSIAITCIVQLYLVIFIGTKVINIFADEYDTKNNLKD